MSVKTIYTCDRCKAEFAEHGHTRSLDVSTNDNWRDKPYRGFIAAPARVDWCFECCKAVGIIQPFKGDPAIEGVAPAPTMEELLREMIYGAVREEVAQYVER